MKKSLLITINQVNRAIYDAQNDLYSSGLWYERAPLTEVEIYLCPLPRLMVRGVFYHGENAWSKMVGYYEGKM